MNITGTSGSVKKKKKVISLQDKCHCSGVRHQMGIVFQLFMAFEGCCMDRCKGELFLTNLALDDKCNIYIRLVS